MRWFKHMTSARDNEDLSELLENYGAEGYGVWWIILELIAAQMDKSDKCSARYSFKKWAKSCQVSTKKFQKVTSFLSELEQISIKECENNTDFLIIKCVKLLKFRDEYSKKSRQTPDKLPPESGETPDQEPETEPETELKLKRKKEREFREKAFEKWWPTYPKRKGKRVGKQEAKEQFIKIDVSEYEDLKKATMNYSTEEYPKDACRFLKKDYWKDWINVDTPPDPGETNNQSREQESNENEFQFPQNYDDKIPI
ncbi:DUF4373 domain-containing protein [Candidatus Pacearchaeota archaeon]|nr:DUF4373 domain-containing protein [Candidatus Pacearchaeota archaeon]